MSQFLQRNKRKGALAALLLMLRRGKGLAALLMMILMLSSVFIVPSGFFMGIPWVAKAVNMLGLAALFADSGNGGFSEFAEALRNARSSRNLMPTGAYRSRSGGMNLSQSGMDLVRGELRDGQAKTYDGVAKDAGASVDGVLRPEDSKKMHEGVALSEGELADGLLKSAMAGTFAQGGGPGGGVFSDRMGLRGGSGASGSMSLATTGGVGNTSGVSKSGGARGGAGAGRAVTRDTRLASSVFRGGARGQSYLSGVNGGQLGKMVPGGTSYQRAYGGGASAAADSCFTGAPAIGPAQQKAYVTGGHRAQGTPTSADANGETFNSLAAGCVLGEVASPPTCISDCPGEFASGVSGAIYDGNKVDEGMIASPNEPVPVTPDMTEVGGLLDQANQMEEDAKKCEEAEATYGPQERQLMSDIQELSSEASATCGGGGCEDNEDACRSLCNQMTSKCNEYNTVAAQKAAACPLSNGQFEAMDCAIGGGC
ncbi:MAG: hypothetical protein A2X36_14065 [Elusimicrobia bacterium GWA2_69_24]|nr:MAG: hypothetical protein A2X36_14065 [Elusimicrobia bacterium GWA2_69_24]HBL17292.1 hypothetical protein [Elusimicrobiota bacterium]